MARANDLMTIWLWPLSLMRAHFDYLEMVLGAQAVVGARLPLIASALQSPLTADYRELTRMVTEKSDAYRLSHAAFASAGRIIQAASEANARDLGALSGGTMLSAAQWQAMITRSLKAGAAFARLPGAALAPVHGRVRANAKRLRR